MLKKIWQLGEKLKPVFIFLIPSLLIGAIIGSVPGYKAYEYVWKDPDFCTACHVHDYATIAWENSSHKQLTTCHDCHHQSLRDYMKSAYSLILHQPKFPFDLDHVPHVPKGICKACHFTNPEDTSTISGPLGPDMVKKLPKVDKTYLHQVHLAQTTKLQLLKEEKIAPELRMGTKSFLPSSHEGDLRSITCSDCHGGPSNRAHNLTVTDSACLRCHEQKHKTPVVKEFGCRQCHFHQFMLTAD